MKWTKIATVLGLLLLLAGCAPIQSLGPFFDVKDVVFEPALLGQWAGKKGSDEEKWKLRLEKSGADAYELKFTSSDAEAGEDQPQEITYTFNAHLFHVGKSLFLDLELTGRTVRLAQGSFSESGEDFMLFLAPTHTVYRVKLDGDHLQLAYPDDEKVHDFLTKKNARIAYVQSGNIVLTGTSRELQEILLAHAEDEKLLSHEIEFERQK